MSRKSWLRRVKTEECSRSLERGDGATLEISDVKLTDVLPLERQWEVLSAPTHPLHHVLLPALSFSSTRHDKAQTPRERVEQNRGAETRAHLLDLRNEGRLQGHAATGHCSTRPSRMGG